MTTSTFKPAFSLLNHRGAVVTETDLHGKYTLVFFGFTNCKVVCPRAIERLKSVLDDIGPETSKRINAVYISVDSERDTPSKLYDFLDKKGASNFIGLTGTKEQLESVRQAFHVFAQHKTDNSVPDGYTISHTAITFILGPGGQVLDNLNDSLSKEEVVKRLQKLLSMNLDAKVSTPYLTVLDQESTMAESYGKMSKKQVASIRHIGNLARQLKGDWSNMMGRWDLNDGFGAYRFQLAYSFYALALAHFHRLPAASGLFKYTMEKMINKILSPDCWYYWRDASTGGGIARTPRTEGWVDPVTKDNIMYSAYVQTMTLLYNSLFDDTRYRKPGALTMTYDPVLWGDGAFTFEYDQNSLNDKVYWNMVESGFLGVACEPHCVFQICNQPPILGFRLSDVLNGTTTAQEVTSGYVKAWEEFGGSLSQNGGYNTFVSTHNKVLYPSTGTGGDCWAALLMHAWRPQFVEDNYQKKRDAMIERLNDGTISLKLPDMTSSASAVPHDPFAADAFGWVAALAAETGDDEVLHGMLAYAEKHFSPVIMNGGLFYPRRDDIVDENGHYVQNTPMQGNAILPLARLNVSKGFQRLYENPWGPNDRHYSEPALDVVGQSIDVYRAVFLPEENILLFDVAVFEPGANGKVELTRVFNRGDWTLHCDTRKVAWGDSERLLGSESFVEAKSNNGNLVISIPDTEVMSFQMQWFV
ncbi:SCO2-like protein [Fusarium pseudocircinatum]|uniref:SCO2-like protein n=1 Tax=Fusarium pseudocircinatum TaxID=56676 RepID=A0A8H5PXZ4_9HYPO|nr:SCO2-like protein [Fusarium pseudocircinatum]